MKKILLTLLSFVFVLSMGAFCFTSCDNTDNSSGSSPDSTFRSSDTSNTNTAPDNTGSDSTGDDNQGENTTEEDGLVSKNGAGLSFALNERKNAYSVIGLNNFVYTKVIIPTEYNGLPVTNIRDAAFRNCTLLTEIVVPTSITAIGNNIFSVPNVYQIILYEGTQESWENIIENSYYENVYFYSETAPQTEGNYWRYVDDEPVVWEESYLLVYQYSASEGGYCVIGCTGEPIDVVIPSEYNGLPIVSVGGRQSWFTFYYPFENCTTLKNVTISEGISSISSYAFSNCVSLKKVIIPESVTDFGSCVFLNCTSLTEINLPNSITAISRYTFQNCTSLKKLIIPDSVTYLGEAAFRNCSSLKEINIPNSVTFLGPVIFQGCSALTKITIPEGVTEINQDAFKDCISLMEINLPESITEIYPNAFENTGYWNNAVNDNLIIIDDWLVGYTGEPAIVPVPETVRYIAQQVFSDCSFLKEIILPVGLKSIGAYAFNRCASLQEVTLPDTLEGISDSAFRGCSSLKKIVIPESVLSIGSYAFSYCVALEEVFMGDNVTHIGAGAFDHCIAIKSIDLSENIKQIGENTFDYCLELEMVTLPVALQTIEDNAFRDCYQLKKIIMFNSVDIVEDSAFWACSGLRTVYYKGTEEEWNKLEIERLVQGTRPIETIIYYYCETDPQTEGNYWRYVDDEPVVW